MPGTVITERVREKFKRFSETGRVFFMGAACGFGKSTVAEELLSGKRVKRISFPEGDISSVTTDGWDFFLADGLHTIQDRSVSDALVALIRENSGKKFVILSRGQVPGYLMPFSYSGIMETVGSGDLFFDRAETAKLLSKSGRVFSEEDISALYSLTMGYPLALMIASRRLAEGEKLGAAFTKRIAAEIYHYFEEAVYHRLDMPTRRFLLDLSPFERFDTELAKMVTGSKDAGETLSSLIENSNMMVADPEGGFHFWQIFRNFLVWEDERTRSDAQRRTVMSRGALFYELHGNIGKALCFYEKSGESDKVSELLIKSTYLHPGMGHYEELEKYYLSLDKKTVERSPALMQALSMLSALRSDYSESEKWYGTLKRFADSLEKGDAVKKEAKSRLAWLDISLPQRGVDNLTETIPAVFTLMKNKEISLPSFSVTSAMPSILNGGKDFSDWTGKDDLLYNTIRMPVEAVLGADGVGLPDIAIAESKFEKGEDIGARMLSIVSKMSEIQAKGTSDIEFAAVGLLARSQLAAGRIEDAKRAVSALYERFSDDEHSRFRPNIRALMCRIALRERDDEFVNEWFSFEAVRDVMNLRVLKRYRYFTEAMVRISRGDNEGALLTLAPLSKYCASCNRHIDMTHLKFLSALAKKRMGLSWREDFSEAVKISERYGFLRTIGMYGKNALELITDSGIGQKGFLKKLTDASRIQAVFYPDFLRPKYMGKETLTEAETAVLRLLAADKSNAEIGEILDIRLATVKSHVSHILGKLGAKKRSEAITAAEKLNII